MKHPRYILVAQQPPTRREETRQVLEAAGYHVTVAADGPAAAALAAKAGRPYDAVVLDLALGGMSGLELAHRLRATPGGADAPLICVVPTDVDGRRREAFGRWFAACLVEPVARGTLVEAVARAIAGPQAHSA